MRTQSSGFTLVEIAIVLVIIGLLLGGILKGQELINSARVKALASDFRTLPAYLYSYQDKFRAYPGDDARAAANVGCAAPCLPGDGNGQLTGNWNSDNVADESWQVWGHLRRAQLAPGATTWVAANATDPYVPRNATGGRVGLTGGSPGQLQISGMGGSWQICSSGILGKYAKQLDVNLDDGNTAGGSLRVVRDGATLGDPAEPTASVGSEDAYTVCMTF